jgi:hypothetical protein
MPQTKPRKRRSRHHKPGPSSKKAALAVLRDPVEFRRMLRMLPADHPLALISSPDRYDVRDP